jgi:hypothetical protein
MGIKSVIKDQPFISLQKKEMGNIIFLYVLAL